MKRIQVILVLLMAVLLVCTTGLAPKVYADDGSALLVPVSLHNAGATEATTSAAPPGGEGTEGDPDSMGDGLSRHLQDAGVLNSAAESLTSSQDEWAIQMTLLYVLAQIQLLVP